MPEKNKGGIFTCLSRRKSKFTPPFACKKSIFLYFDTLPIYLFQKIHQIPAVADRFVTSVKSGVSEPIFSGNILALNFQFWMGNFNLQ